MFSIVFTIAESALFLTGAIIWRRKQNDYEMWPQIGWWSVDVVLDNAFWKMNTIDFSFKFCLMYGVTVQLITYYWQRVASVPLLACLFAAKTCTFPDDNVWSPEIFAVLHTDLHSNTSLAISVLQYSAELFKLSLLVEQILDWPIHFSLTSVITQKLLTSNYARKLGGQ